MGGLVSCCLLGIGEEEEGEWKVVVVVELGTYDEAGASCEDGGGHFEWL